MASGAIAAGASGRKLAEDLKIQAISHRISAQHLKTLSSFFGGPGQHTVRNSQALSIIQFGA